MSSAVAPAHTPAINDPLVFEGHRYTLTAFDPRGVFRFDRPAEQGVGDTPKRMGLGVTADLTWAEDLKAWYLPLRVGPRLSSLLEELFAAGHKPEVVTAVQRHVQSHPAYVADGRDDLAFADARAAHLEG